MQTQPLASSIPPAMSVTQITTRIPALLSLYVAAICNVQDILCDVMRDLFDPCQ